MTDEVLVWLQPNWLVHRSLLFDSSGFQVFRSTQVGRKLVRRKKALGEQSRQLMVVRKMLAQSRRTEVAKCPVPKRRS